MRYVRIELLPREVTYQEAKGLKLPPASKGLIVGVLPPGLIPRIGTGINLPVDEAVVGPGPIPEVRREWKTAPPHLMPFQKRIRQPRRQTPKEFPIPTRQSQQRAPTEFTVPHRVGSRVQGEGNDQAVDVTEPGISLEQWSVSGGLKITIPMRDWEPWNDSFHDAIVLGNMNVAVPPLETTIGFRGGDGLKRFTLNLKSSISNLTLPPHTANAELVALFTVELAVVDDAVSLSVP